MKNFLLMLLGKETNESIDDSIAGVFRSECYYDWIQLKIITKPETVKENSPEVLLVSSYSEEVKTRQEMMDNGLHVQQSIIALPADDEDDKDSYNKFLSDVSNANVVYISFINLPVWSQKDIKKITTSVGAYKFKSVNEVVNQKITKIIDKSSMRLFHTFDHNDFVLICNGSEISLNNYMNTLEQIRLLLLMDNCPAVHDITTIYGYKRCRTCELNKSGKISAVVSISGQDVFSSDISSSFRVETVGRYDHLSEYKDITWQQLSEMSKLIHSSNIITSRIHIGSELSGGLTAKKQKIKFPEQKMSPLYNKFEDICKEELDSMEYGVLVEVYGGDEEYIAFIKLLLNEIRLAVSTTLRRGFSKYNSVCYIEPYRYFVKYIKEKIIEKLHNSADNDISEETDTAGNLAETLVDISNSFYKSILTLDSSIMHSERRFVMSDPYQLMLFDVPPKLIAYYTAVASNMAKTLNGRSKNKYVFLITPDVKKDIYVESITDNRDINSEINILVIHVNERHIYNVSDTTKSLAHEIAHHVGQNQKLRKKRGVFFIKCYIALLISKCLDSDLFTNHNSVDSVVCIIENLVDDIFAIEKTELLSDKEKYYYMDELKDNCLTLMRKKLKEVWKIDNKLYDILHKHFGTQAILDYIRRSDHFFADPDKSSLANDTILYEYLYRHILEVAYEKLEPYLNDQKKVTKDIEFISFIFKEGYADVQMILLTEDSTLNTHEIIDNYVKLFERVSDRTDEIMRKITVTNTFLDKPERNYDAVADLKSIKEDGILNQAYFTYICKQATEYFSTIKELNRFKNHDSKYNKKFDRSKAYLFKNNNLNEIIQQVDNTIISYVENIL